MHLAIFNRLKELIRELGMDFKQIIFGNVVRRLPAPDDIGDYLPMLIIEPKEIITNFVDAQKRMREETTTWTMYYIHEWTPEEEDLQKRINIAKKIESVIPLLKNFENKEGRVISVTTTSIDKDVDFELFLRTTFAVTEITSIGVNFETKTLLKGGLYVNLN